MKNLFVFFFIVVFLGNIIAQDSQQSDFQYQFLIQDKPAILSTMRQMNVSYLSISRLLHRFSHSYISGRDANNLLLAMIHSLFFIPLTHEEGHRSILTARHIGSVSQPYFNKHGAAYVKGVTDAVLQNLRDNFFSEYIRLHIAGLESDYMLTKRVETLLSFEQEEFKNVKWEYWNRKIAIVQYYLSGLLKFEVGLEEESNELDRDIVGHDVYGAIRHLHRPTMNFYRYTNYSHLTVSEREFANMVGWLSLLNLVSPSLLGNRNLKVNDQLKLNFGLGYTMAPFGGFIDQHIWFKYRKFNMMIYFRQFHNKHSWFFAGGAEIHQIPVFSQLYFTIQCHLWQQPYNYLFRTKQSFCGGAIDFYAQYFFKSPIATKRMSVDIGTMYKTKGFLPEELYLKEMLSFRIGTTLQL